MQQLKSAGIENIDGWLERHTQHRWSSSATHYLNSFNIHQQLPALLVPYLHDPWSMLRIFLYFSRQWIKDLESLDLHWYIFALNNHMMLTFIPASSRGDSSITFFSVHGRFLTYFLCLIWYPSAFIVRGKKNHLLSFLCVRVLVCLYLQQALLSPLAPPPFLWASCSSTLWPSRGSMVRPWPPPRSHSRDSRLSSASLPLSLSQVTPPLPTAPSRMPLARLTLRHRTRLLAPTVAKLSLQILLHFPTRGTNRRHFHCCRVLTRHHVFPLRTPRSRGSPAVPGHSGPPQHPVHLQQWQQPRDLPHVQQLHR